MNTVNIVDTVGAVDTTNVDTAKKLWEVLAVCFLALNSLMVFLEVPLS